MISIIGWGNETYIPNCKHLNTCNQGIKRNCNGCNIWNLKYDQDSLIQWCKDHDMKLFDVIENLHDNLL